jgi:site-specific DNA recombinase
MVRVSELSGYLAWDGIGLFPKALTSRLHQSGHIHCIRVAATAVRSDRRFTLPIPPPPSGARVRRNKRLVALLALSRKTAEAVYGARNGSVDAVSIQFRRTPAFIHRVLRLNYLAPDIIAAILDGRQPPGLTRKGLLYASLPTDWVQQRLLLGLPHRTQPAPESQAPSSFLLHRGIIEA